MALVDHCERVLGDSTLLSIVSAFCGCFTLTVRILALKRTWLTDNATLVRQHRHAARLRLLGLEGEWSELVQCAAMLEMEELSSTSESSTQIGWSLAVSRVHVAF